MASTSWQKPEIIPIYSSVECVELYLCYPYIFTKARCWGTGSILHSQFWRRFKKKVLKQDASFDDIRPFVLQLTDSSLQIIIPNQQNAQICSLNIYIISHWIFLHVSIRKGPSLGNQNKLTEHKTKLATFVHSWRGEKRVTLLKYGHFFVG
jgi:hypothetical protein